MWQVVFKKEVTIPWYCPSAVQNAHNIYTNAQFCFLIVLLLARINSLLDRLHRAWGMLHRLVERFIGYDNIFEFILRDGVDGVSVCKSQFEIAVSRNQQRTNADDQRADSEAGNCVFHQVRRSRSQQSWRGSHALVIVGGLERLAAPVSKVNATDFRRTNSLSHRDWLWRVNAGLACGEIEQAAQSAVVRA